MSVPSITVVTIAFNDLDGLRKTVESVKSQSFDGALQHLIVDGGSGSETVAYLETLDPRHEWVSEPDRGRYDAMNKGIVGARGDVIWFMHAGDTFGSASSLAQATRHMNSPRDEWGFGYARSVNESGAFLGIFGRFPFKLDRFALGGRPVPHQASFFGAALVERCGSYDLGHGLAADQLFILRAALETPPVFVPEFVCNFNNAGAGTARPVKYHYRDMRRAASVSGYRFKHGRLAYSLLSHFYEYIERTRRAVRKLMHSAAVPLSSGRHPRP